MYLHSNASQTARTLVLALVGEPVPAPLAAHPDLGVRDHLVAPGTVRLYAGGGGPTGGAVGRPVVVTGTPAITVEPGASYPSGTTRWWCVAMTDGDSVTVDGAAYRCDARVPQWSHELAVETARMIRDGYARDVAWCVREGHDPEDTTHRTPSFAEGLRRAERELAALEEAS